MLNVNLDSGSKSGETITGKLISNIATTLVVILRGITTITDYGVKCHDSGMSNNLLAKQITKQPLFERLSFLGTAPHSAHVARVWLF